MSACNTMTSVPTTIDDDKGPVESVPEDEKVLTKRKRGRDNQQAHRDRKKAKEVALENRVGELSRKLEETEMENIQLKNEKESKQNIVGDGVTGNWPTTVVADVFVQKNPGYDNDGASCSSMQSVSELQYTKVHAKENAKKWAADVLAALGELLPKDDWSLLEYLENLENRQKCLLMLTCVLCESFNCGPFKGFAIKTLPKILEIAVNSARNQPVSNNSQLTNMLEHCFAENAGCAKEECRRAKEQLEQREMELQEKDEMVNQLLSVFVSSNVVKNVWRPT